MTPNKLKRKVDQIYNPVLQANHRKGSLAFESQCKESFAQTSISSDWRCQNCDQDD